MEQSRDLVQAQKDYLLECFGVEPEDLDTKDTLLAIICEVVEFIDEGALLPWKNRDPDHEEMKVEVADMLFFLLELCLCVGIKSEEELRSLYFAKMAKNRERAGGDHKAWGTNACPRCGSQVFVVSVGTEPQHYRCSVCGENWHLTGG